MHPLLTWIVDQVNREIKLGESLAVATFKSQGSLLLLAIGQNDIDRRRVDYGRIGADVLEACSNPATKPVRGVNSNRRPPIHGVAINATT